MKDVNRCKTEADTKSGKPYVNPNYTLTRPKHLRNFENNEKGMKVVKKDVEINIDEQYKNYLKKTGKVDSHLSFMEFKSYTNKLASRY